MRKDSVWINRKSQVDDLLEQGATYNELATLYGCSRQRIEQVIRELGLDTATVRRERRMIRAAAVNLTVHHAAGKTCAKCGEYKLYEEFHLNSQNKAGRHSYCAECVNANAEEWYYKRGGQAKGKQWREKNKEKIKEYQKTYAANHPDRINASRRANYKKNREKILASSKRWREANREKVNAYQREYYAKRKAAESE